MKLRRRVPDYTTPDWVHSLQEGPGPRFGENPLKTTENMGLDPLIAPSFEKVWIRRVQNAGVSTLADEFTPYREEEGVYFEKKYRSIYLS